MDRIKIYTNGTCPYCKSIKEELDKNNIEYTEILTSEHQEQWNKVIRLTNLPTTPTIYYKDFYFIPGRDFNSPQNLINILKNFKKSEFSESRRALEQVRTLNYNMATAFGRLDQLLRQIENKLNTKENEHKSTN